MKSSRFVPASIERWARVVGCSGLIGLFAVAATAQLQTHVGYPQDTTIDAMSTNVLGRHGAGLIDESRVHILVPTQFLPPLGGTIVGIELVATATVTLPYTLLRINADHMLNTTPGAYPTLSRTFANNLTAPVTVLNRTSQFSIIYLSRQWCQILFSTPFSYRGGQHLVLEFQKVVGVGAASAVWHVSAGQERTPLGRLFDLPRMETSWGPLGSNAHQALTGVTTGSRYPPRLRLVFQGTPSMVPDSGTHWGLGTNATLTTYVSPGSLAWQTIDLANRTLAASAPLNIPPLAGTGWVVPGSSSAFLLGPLGATTQSIPVPIPNNVNLRGIDVVFQSIVYDPLANQLIWTNAADATLR